MAENSGISWTDNTINPWIGCTKVSPACANCYAERDMDHRFGRVKWGPNGTRLLTSQANWKKPFIWNKLAGQGQCIACAGKGHRKSQTCSTCLGTGAINHRPRVFCASLADVFEAWDGPVVNSYGHPVFEEATRYDTTTRKPVAVSKVERNITLDDLRADLFAVIDKTPNLDWLLLTKRPENIRRMWLPKYHYSPAYVSGGEIHGPDGFEDDLRSNVWIGCTVENQEHADKRIPELLKCRDLSPVLFLSCEPLLGAVDLRPVLWLEDQYFGFRNPSKLVTQCGIDWVITGGESGPAARPSHPDWFRSLRDQCAAASVSFHFKQWGEWVEPQQCGGVSGMDKMSAMHPDGTQYKDKDIIPRGQRIAIQYRVGVKRSGRLLDGALHDAFPEGVGVS